MQNYFKKITLKTTILLFLGFSAKSQTIDTITNYSWKSQISFHSSTNIYRGLTYRSVNQKIIQPKVTQAPNLGIELSRKINSIELNFGIHWSKVSYKEDFTVTLNNELLEKYDKTYHHRGFKEYLLTEYFHFPFSFSKNIIFSSIKNTLLKYSLGMNINYIHPFEYTFLAEVCEKQELDNPIFENCIPVYNYEITQSNGWFVGVFGKIGVHKATKRAGYNYGVNLLVNYTPQPIGKGRYEFTNVQEASFGKVTARLNYIGLELVQGITLKKDNIINLYKNDKPYYIIYDTLKAKNQLKFSVMPILFGGMKVTPIVGEKVLASIPSPSIAAGISYYHTIKDNLGVNTGIQIGGIAEQERVNTLNRSSTYNTKTYLSSHYISSHYISTPVSLQMVLKEKKLFDITGIVGFSAMYIKPYQNIGIWAWSHGSNENELEYSELHVNVQPKNEFAFGAFTKIGIVKSTENAGSSLELNLVIHYSPTIIAKGEYNFISEATDVFKQGGGNGIITQNINYIGLEMVYGLTLKKQKK